MYADDTCITVTADNIAELRHKLNLELNSISERFLGRKLTINTKKTKHVVFQSRFKVVDTTALNIQINSISLEQTSSYKYLGVVFDKHLQWEEHINSVCSRLASGCYGLTLAREYFDIPVLQLMYFAFIESHLRYCTDSWGWAYKTLLNSKNVQ